MMASKAAGPCSGNEIGRVLERVTSALRLTSLDTFLSCNDRNSTSFLMLDVGEPILGLVWE
jgi:hypothetical protein